MKSIQQGISVNKVGFFIFRTNRPVGINQWIVNLEDCFSSISNTDFYFNEQLRDKKTQYVF